MDDRVCYYMLYLDPGVRNRLRLDFFNNKDLFERAVCERNQVGGHIVLELSTACSQAYKYQLVDALCSFY